MYTEFFMFFTTQIGQPLDASVHVSLKRKYWSIVCMYSTYYRHVHEFNFGVSGIISKHKKIKKYRK